MDLLGFVVVRSHLQQPLVLNFDHLAHKLLGGKDQLVIDQAPRLLFKEAAVGMDVYHLLVLDSPVSSLPHASRMVEVPRYDGLKGNNTQTTDLPQCMSWVVTLSTTFWMATIS